MPRGEAAFARELAIMARIPHRPAATNSPEKMIATQVRQKDSVYYFVAYPADELLKKIRFISRFYGEGEQIAPDVPTDNDEIAAFISRVERSDAAFQRQMSKSKVRSLYTVTRTPMTLPLRWAEAALNFWMNCPGFTPCWPSAGPMGGAGVAVPPGACSLN